jgi:hypothetical protein
MEKGVFKIIIIDLIYTYIQISTTYHVNIFNLYISLSAPT